MKALLVGDWENVSKNKLLVPLPSPHTVKDMIDEYIATQKEKRKLSATEEALMVECMIGLNVYFDSTLSRILLYRYVSYHIAHKYTIRSNVCVQALSVFSTKRSSEPGRIQNRSCMARRHAQHMVLST